MVSTHQKIKSNTRLPSQLRDFDQDIIIGTAASDRQQNVVINENTVGQEFTVDFSGSNLIT